MHIRTKWTNQLTRTRPVIGNTTGALAREVLFSLASYIQKMHSLAALTKEEILANCILFMMVGYETTANALSWALHLLAFHPEVQERLFLEIKSKMEETGV